MKLTSLWTSYPVYWRVFGPNDEAYITGIEDGIINASLASLPTFSYAEADVFAGEPNVQLELKQDGVFGAFILPASRTRIFQRRRHYVLRASGIVDDFREPTLRVTAPAINATLPSSRLNQKDMLEAELDLRDWFALNLNYGLDQLEVFFFYRYSGQNEVKIADRATGVRVGLESPLVRFGCAFKFPRAGSLEISCRILAPAGKLMSTAWVPAQVAPTGVRTIDARFVNAISGTNPPAYPAIASTISATLVTNAQDYFARIEYRFAPPGLSNPSLPWTATSAPPAPAGAASREWPVGLPIGANAAPGHYSLIVRDVDAFGEDSFRSYPFYLRDVTPPEIVIDKPGDNEAFVTNDPAGLVIHASGRIRDAQTAVDPESVAYTIGDVPQPVAVSVVVINGVPWHAWYAQLQPGGYGVFDLRITASDTASPGPNWKTEVRRFTVASAYRPSTLEELLSPQSYLRELLRFAASHLAKGAGSPPPPVKTEDLETRFYQPFEALARPNAPESTEVGNDVLVPVRLLRARERLLDQDTAAELAAAAALLGRWDFTELASGATDGLIERFRGFGSFRLVGGYRRAPDDQAIGSTAIELTGAARTPLEGTFLSTGTSHVLIGNSVAPDWTRRALRLGRSNRDFSLSLWIWPEDSGAGVWRAVVHKGNEASVEPAEWNRTPGIWLHPTENRVRFQISTAADHNAGGDSAARLPVGAWTHLVYVKSGRRLRLYVNGLLDQEVALPSGDILANDDPLYLGANPYQQGFLGALSEFRIYGVALGEDEVRRLAEDRRAGLPNVGILPDTDADTALHRYCNRTYGTLLAGLGTSREEIGAIGSLTPDQQRALETRLGLAGLPWKPGQVLDALVPSSTTDVRQFEYYLASSFGVPYTSWPTDDLWAPGGTPVVLQLQQAGLELAYVREDADPARWPDLDPDLVDWAELDPAAVAWRALHVARSGELAAKFRELSDATLTATELVAKVFNDAEYKQLRQLGEDDAAGLPIADGVAAMALDLPMLRRLLVYLDQPANRPLSAEQRTDLAHLLVEAWKRRTLRADWVREEAALPTRPWPSVAGPGAWVPGRYRRDFLPWRGSVRRRTALEERLGRRQRAFDALNRDYARLLMDVQRANLPTLRDDLLGIGDLPALAPRLGALQQILLADLTAAGALDLSAADQAIASLQVLLNGIRRGWFGDGHPARDWRPRDSANFDAQWDGIDSYGRWRASVLNYLYPENTLYPELREANSEEFKECLKQLRAIQPLTVAALEDAATDYAKKVDILPGESVERNFFLPVAEGLALQRSGQLEAALDRYAKVLDVTASPGNRRRKEPIVSEPVAQPASVVFATLDWAARLNNPHERASRPVGQRAGCQNPYTRFVLFQILHCTLARADAAFARGTLDDRALARALYLEAQDILALDELVDVPPTQGGQAYLPNPLLEAYNARAASALRKLSRGLSILGTPLPPDPTRGAGAAGLSSLVRPTPYRYRVLVDRAKHLAGMAQQFEEQYLSAIERNEAALEKLMQEGFALELAGQTSELRRLGVTEAQTGEGLAVLQEGRSHIERDRYNEWLAAGDNYYERQQLDGMEKATGLRQLVNGFQAVAAVATASASAAATAVKTFGVASGFSVGAAVAHAGAGVAQGFLIAQESLNQTNAFYAARERRNEEMQLRRDLAEQDTLIGAQQVQLARDRIAIARQELTIAQAQVAQATQMLAFLRNKFTSAEFYDWLSGVLAESYGFFLQLAAAAARQAELQLAFERQEPPQRLVRADYWKLASSDGNQDRRGITGSARLLQDLYSLEQYAFSSERRLLNLTQSFSLERLMPVELGEFRRTGVLVFATPMAWFDEGFPGHYLRLIKRVRISVVALIPPSVGIRATLSNGGLSRVVTADPGYPTMVIQQDPQAVALTSPTAESGVFELDVQSDLIFPFEGTGVDTSWILELPRAANPFDFDSLMDVVISLDYTALANVDLRERVIKALPRQSMGDRSFSIKRDLPDTWYEIANGSGDTVNLTLPVSRLNFPPGLTDVRVSELALSARTTSGVPCAFVATLTITTPGGSPRVGATVHSIGGIASSRQTGGRGWHSRQVEDQTLDVIDKLPPLGDGPTQWAFAVGNQPTTSVGDETTFLQQLRAGTVEDILVVMTFSGQRPAWG